jgi:cullin-associated NEDD8-dissociated protein 1
MASLVRKTGEGVLANFSLDEGNDYVSHAPQSRKRRRESSTATFDAKALISMSAGLTSPATEPLPTSGPRADLSKLSPAIIKSATKLMKGNSIPTKQAIINLLDDMVSVQNGGLAEYFSQVVDLIIESIKSAGGSSGSSTAITSGGAASATAHTLRIAALKLIGDISKTHSSSVLQPFLPKIIPGVISAVNDKYYKISSEAIGTVEQLVKALTPPRSAASNHSADLQKLYQVILSKVSATDADLEVRQRAIRALGILLARTSSPEGVTLLSSADRTSAMNVLSDRLKNETTRLAAVHAIDTVAASITNKDQLQPKWIREVSLELSAQLRKANRALRGASLAALKSLVITTAARNSLDAPTIEGLVSALLPLLTNVDYHLLAPALQVLAALVTDDARLVVTEQLNASMCNLLKGNLSGAALDAVLLMVTNIGKQGVGQPLMTGLLRDVSVNGDPAVVGKVIGTLLVYGGSSSGVKLQDFVSELNNPQSEDAKRSLALAVLGEAGLKEGAKSPLKPSVFTQQFKSRSDKVRLAAAVALGRAGAGNIPLYLPEITTTMAKGGNTQYLLLHSIKEILQQAGNNSADISRYTKSIWDRLLIASQSEDNKAVGAECIGRLAIIDPKTYMPQLHVSFGYISTLNDIC